MSKVWHIYLGVVRAWTMTSKEFGDYPVEVSTSLSHCVSLWVRTKEFVYPVLTPEAIQEQIIRVRREDTM